MVRRDVRRSVLSPQPLLVLISHLFVMRRSLGILKFVRPPGGAENTTTVHGCILYALQYIISRGSSRKASRQAAGPRCALCFRRWVGTLGSERRTCSNTPPPQPCSALLCILHAQPRRPSQRAHPPTKAQCTWGLSRPRLSRPQPRRGSRSCYSAAAGPRARAASASPCCPRACARPAPAWPNPATSVTLRRPCAGQRGVAAASFPPRQRGVAAASLPPLFLCGLRVARAVRSSPGPAGSAGASRWASDGLLVGFGHGEGGRAGG